MVFFKKSWFIATLSLGAPYRALWGPPRGSVPRSALCPGGFAACARPGASLSAARRSRLGSASRLPWLAWLDFGLDFGLWIWLDFWILFLIWFDLILILSRFWLDFGWFWFDFYLILVGFGLILIRFRLDLAWFQFDSAWFWLDSAWFWLDSAWFRID